MRDLSADEEFDDFFDDIIDIAVQLFIGQVGYGVWDFQKSITRNPPVFRHGFPGHTKRCCNDGNSRNAGLFNQDPVEHTARAAGPSVTDAGNGDVGGLLEFSERCFRDRMTGRLFGINPGQGGAESLS